MHYFTKLRQVLSDSLRQASGNSVPLPVAARRLRHLQPPNLIAMHHVRRPSAVGLGAAGSH